MTMAYLGDNPEVLSLSCIGEFNVEQTRSDWREDQFTFAFQSSAFVNAADSEAHQATRDNSILLTCFSHIVILIW